MFRFGGVSMDASVRMGLRVKPKDEKLFHQLSEYLGLDLSTTIRFSVRKTARDYGLIPDKSKTGEIEETEKEEET